MSIDATIALISLDDAKTFLKITGNGEDGVIGDFVNMASEYANRETGRHLLQKSYTEHYDGDGTRELILNQHPVQSITSIHDDVDRVFGADTQIDVSADVMVDTKAGILRLWNNEAAFLKGAGNVKVVYSAGYTIGTVPYDIREAVSLILAHIYRRFYQEQRIGIQSESIGDRTLTYSDTDIPAKAKKILSRYRNPRAAHYAF